MADYWFALATNSHFPPNAPAPGSAKLESVLFTSDCFTPLLIYMPAAATRFMFDPLGSHFQRTKL
jgi:hypothetical protein